VLPAPPGRAGGNLIAGTVVSGIITVISLIVFIYASRYTAVCNSDAGQLAQMFDSRAVNDCATASTVHGVSLAIMIVSALTAAACLAAYLSRRDAGRRG
jgi:hypothetical protein